MSVYKTFDDLKEYSRVYNAGELVNKVVYKDKDYQQIETVYMDNINDFISYQVPKGTKHHLVTKVRKPENTSNKVTF